MKIAFRGIKICRRLANASLKCYQSYEHDRRHRSLSESGLLIWIKFCLIYRDGIAEAVARMKLW